MVPPTNAFSPVPLPKTAERRLSPYGLNGGDSLAKGRTYSITSWKKWKMGQRLAFLRTLIEGDSEDTGWMKDPQIKELARWIVGQAKIDVYAHPEQAWGALLAWVQANVPYINEPGEQFQSPQYTLECARRKMGGADCDDLMILLASLGGSLGLPWRMVIYGTARNGQKVRYVESPKSHGEGVSFMLLAPNNQSRTVRMTIGGPVPEGVRWAHIYLACGLGSLHASTYTFAEPTLKVPLGWDALEQRYNGGRSDISGAVSGLFAGTDTTPSAQGWLQSAWEDVKANVSPGKVVAAVLPSLVVLYLTSGKRKR
jgi:hypothetical protein